MKVADETLMHAFAPWIVKPKMIRRYRMVAVIGRDAEKPSTWTAAATHDDADEWRKWWTMVALQRLRRADAMDAVMAYFENERDN